MNPKKILNANELSTILHRLSFQLIEDHNDFSNTVLVGIQPRGALLGNRLLKLLCDNNKSNDINLGLLDITFFRDDFRRSEKSLKASTTKLEFTIENKTVILIDDVLYTGRSIRAALDAIQSFGRPKSVQLLTLIDRRFSRELPIQPDYCGIQVDSRLNEKVKVNWNENDGEDSVYLIKNKE
ncbi:MAG: bifunctional pyr operon transcriptional regulator/uracil phosphoribosyltransferase PyrR [Flavobacteriales bacterium]|jgi:pyrimidine operon attenuation protein/uracil phosphoribosyltransferase|tara:strand:- start:5797 stop:6342 length:546 start_codon:yes stop_codon:yes gene_type:complete